jgi:hypothetical protein
MLCAAVNAVMARASWRKVDVRRKRPSTNRRWSYPSRMCSTPSEK